MFTQEQVDAIVDEEVNAVLAFTFQKVQELVTTFESATRDAINEYVTNPDEALAVKVKIEAHMTAFGLELLEEARHMEDQ